MTKYLLILGGSCSWSRGEDSENCLIWNGLINSITGSACLGFMRRTFPNEKKNCYDEKI